MRKFVKDQGNLFGEEPPPLVSDGIDRAAEFSSDEARRFRYVLYRRWKPSLGRVVFICLNPSKADEFRDDNTVTRSIIYTKTWGYGEFVMLNLYAFRSTDSDELKRSIARGEDIIGEGNDEAIERILREDATKLVVAAWGTKSPIKERASKVVELATRYRDVACLKTTKDGHPEHPLYLKKTLSPTLYKAIAR